MWRQLRERWLSRAPAARMETPAAPDPPAPDPEIIEKFAKQAHDLDALRKSVEDAAAVSAGFWLSYLFVLLYIAIAAGAVTHNDLLLENPVKLPVLNVELPLVAFFVLAPIIFIISHAYTLVYFVMLGAKVGTFDTELRKQLPDSDEAKPEDDNAAFAAQSSDPRETRQALRRQLPSNIFVQFLAGPEDRRNGGLGLILKAIAWFSLVIGPVLLLLLVEAQFLPYHLEWVAWVQRVAIVVDMILLWLLWPAVLNGRSKLMWRLERRRKGWPGVLDLTGRYIVGFAACLIPIGLAFTAATFPGEKMEEWIVKRQWIPPYPSAKWSDQKDWMSFLTTWYGQEGWTTFHDLLFNGYVDDVTRQRKSLFSNTLVLPSFDALEAMKIDDPKKLGLVKHSVVLHGRHLESAVFRGADLRKADLVGAHLRDTSLLRAQLQGALLNGAQLQRASLNGAQLQGALLEGAQLQGASLSGAQLQGASFNGAQLQGALLEGAQLQGASLDNAQLQGASLDGAQLQGALLEGAQLQGASFAYAQLQGASLLRAQLQGAVLMFANLQGASLYTAHLEGAVLMFAQLQGANFGGAILAGTTMFNAAVWRASFEGASVTDVFEEGVNESALSKDEFAVLQAMIVKDVPEGGKRDYALDRIEKLNPDKPKASELEKLEKGSGDETAYRSALADQLKLLACSGDESALHIVRGLARETLVGIGGIIRVTGDQAPGLVEAILKDCPVSADLTVADKAALNKLAKKASGTR